MKYAVGLGKERSELQRAQVAFDEVKVLGFGEAGEIALLHLAGVIRGE
jgi:hypothetical protein